MRYKSRSLKSSVAAIALATALATTLSACNNDDVAPEGAVEALVLPQLAPEATITRIAFGSCADEELPQPIWSSIFATDPDLFLFIGDNIYADWIDNKPLAEPGLDIIAEAYDMLGRNPDYSQFRQEVPILATWDDHDYGRNDGGVENPIKAGAKKIMLDFFAVAEDAPVRNRDGVYQSRTFGPEGKRVQIILMDTRWFRSGLKPTDEWGVPGKERYLPDVDASKTMLGEAQWAWLEEQLKAPADLRLIVSSIQVLADGHGWEAWRTMPRERERFYNLLQSSGAENAVLLSGDRHVGGIYRIDDKADYPLYEITSSSLNKSFADGKPIAETGPHQQGTLYGPENFGLISVNWESRNLSLEIKSNSGVTVRSVDLSLDDLDVN